MFFYQSLKNMFLCFYLFFGFFVLFTSPARDSCGARYCNLFVLATMYTFQGL